MENVPHESETIAARRALRLAEKLRKAGSGFADKRAWWSNGIIEIASLILIFLLNFYLIFPFFGTATSEPFFSGPIVPLMAKIVTVFDVPVSYAIQITNIFFFLIFPVSLYIYVKLITGRKLIALLATIIASLPFYPFGEVRVFASLHGNDAAHIASLSVIPIALHGLYLFIRKGGINNLIIASVASAIVALISPFGFMTYIIFSLIFVFSEMLLGTGRVKFVRLAAVFLFAGGLNSFWYNPGFFFWMITGPLGQDIRFMISKLIPISFFVIPVLGTFGYLLFDRKPNLQPVFLASFFTIAFATIVLAGGGLFPSHPSRYVSELGVSLSFLLSVLIVKLFDFVRFSEYKIFTRISKNLSINLSFIIIFLTLISLILMGRDRLIGDEQVLGIWDEVDKGEIWKAKDQFGGIWALIGYTITGINILLLGSLGIRPSIKEKGDNRKLPSENS